MPSEKLVKDSLDLKADITPANGSTSALRALFIARGYDSVAYHCVYNTNTGFYEMNGLTDLTEVDVKDFTHGLNEYETWQLQMQNFISHCFISIHYNTYIIQAS